MEDELFKSLHLNKQKFCWIKTWVEKRDFHFIENKFNTKEFSWNTETNTALSIIQSKLTKGSQEEKKVLLETSMHCIWIRLPRADNFHFDKFRYPKLPFKDDDI